MKRSEIKRRPLSDTALASIEPETREYRELDGSGLYLRVNRMARNPGNFDTKTKRASGAGLA